MNMAKEGAAKKQTPKEKNKKDLYSVSKDGKIERKRKHCPKCGPGVFLGEHKDRVSCGKCGYTEFSKKSK
jgi:small subunit ribosomal protein S27Ae